MSTRFGIVYPPWNHSREAGNLLDRVAGEVGIDHITIPVVTGPLTSFRPCVFPDEPCFYTEGGWHFQPDAKRYEAGGVWPHIAKWIGRRDVLKDLCRRAADHALKLRFEIDVAQAPGVAEHAPLSRRNAWGQALWPEACVNNPAFHELQRAALDDLARYVPAAYVIAAPSGDAFDPCTSVTPDDAAFETCFCTACRDIAAAAGADAELIARDLAARCVRRFTGEAAGAAESGANRTQTGLAEYRRTRFDAVAAWLNRTAEEIAPARLYVAFAGDRRFTDEWTRPTAWSALCRMGRQFSIRRKSALERLGRLPNLMFDVGPFALDASPATELVRFVSECVEGGAESIDFMGVGEVPAAVVDWMRQAVRYARRG